MSEAFPFDVEPPRRVGFRPRRGDLIRMVFPGRDELLFIVSDSRDGDDGATTVSLIPDPENASGT